MVGAPMIFRPELLLTIILVVWSTVLTALFIRFYLYFTRISKKADKQSLISKLDTVLALEMENKKGLEKVQAKYDTLVNDVSFHVQRIGLLRFNPFKDTGGDQSFILTLVDGHNSGVIISSYHTRSGTRWYAKSIKEGKGIEHELTAEEVEALKQGN
jgi:hypothetical protein